MKPTNAVRAFVARPVAVLAVAITLFSFASALLAGCGGNKSEQANQGATQTQTGGTEGSTPAGAPAAEGDLGAKIYSEKCSVCHGAGGKGDGPGGAALNPKPRDHTDGTYMNSRTDAQLLEVIHNGKGAMPAWKGVLSEEEIAAVLKHVRSLAVPPYQGS